MHFLYAQSFINTHHYFHKLLISSNFFKFYLIKLMVKNMQKYKYHELANAIKNNYEAGMKANKIAILFKISPQRVNY